MSPASLLHVGFAFRRLPTIAAAFRYLLFRLIRAVRVPHWSAENEWQLGLDAQNIGQPELIRDLPQIHYPRTSILYTAAFIYRMKGTLSVLF